MKKTAEQSFNLRAALEARDRGRWWSELKAADDYGTPEIISLLKEGLMSPSGGIRSVTPQFVVLANDPSLARSLVDSASKFDNKSSLNAVKALGSMNNRSVDVIDFLMKSLEHRSPHMRVNAADALGRLEISSAVQGLSEAANDRNAGVRLASVEALQRIGSDDAVGALAAIACRGRRWLSTTAAYRRLEAMQESDARRLALQYVQRNGRKRMRRDASKALSVDGRV